MAEGRSFDRSKIDVADDNAGCLLTYTEPRLVWTLDVFKCQFEESFEHSCIAAGALPSGPGANTAPPVVDNRRYLGFWRVSIC